MKLLIDNRDKCAFTTANNNLIEETYKETFSSSYFPMNKLDVIGTPSHFRNLLQSSLKVNLRIAQTCVHASQNLS